MGLPLEGVKVLDLSRLLPGPYATLVLADLGAQVDKVEEPEVGDYTRHAPPMKGDVSALFLALNRNKRSIALDLKSSEGLAALKALARHYDVLVESFRPGVMARLGCGYEVLAAENPRLIVCSVTGFGSTGPDAQRAGHDLGYQARAGLLAYGGAANGAPAHPGAQVADLGGSLFGVIGILAALHERSRTGRGRVVDVSLTESATAFLHMQWGARLALGAEGAPLQRGREALNGGYPCYGLYETADRRWVALGALEPRFFLGLCQALGRPELIDGAWDVGEAGRQTRAALEEIFRQRTRADWVERFQGLDLCVEPVLEGDEARDDAQLRARGLFVEADGVVWLRTPLQMGENIVKRPPRLGEHGDEIRRECGLGP